MDSSSNAWLNDIKKRVIQQRSNIKLLKESEQLDESKLSKLDSSLKKLTAFMKKTKSINSSNTASQLLPELEKLNLLKFLDEIASNICEAKIKQSDIIDLVTFVVQLSCRYHQFPELLLGELKKNLPYRKSDKIDNPIKLKTDLKFLGELILNGVFEKPGIDLLGSVLSYLVQTDTNEYTHVSLLLPFCRPLLFEFVGIIPLSEKLNIKEKEDELEELTTTAFTENNRRAVKTLFKNYYDNLMKQLNTVRIKMNKIHKSIKRQERTKGDASQADRNDFETTKQSYEKLKQLAIEFSEILGEEMPTLIEEPSDDEMDEMAVKQLEGDLTEGRTSLWPDKDTLNFYETLINIRKPDQITEDVDTEETIEEQQPQILLADSVDSVDLTELENQSTDVGQTNDDVVEEEEQEEIEETTAIDKDDQTGQDKMLNLLQKPEFVGMTMNTFLENLSSAMNRDLIDSAATYFVQSLSKKTNRKKLINHFLNSPRDRLDLLPFYARFLATINKVLPDITTSVVNELLIKFRSMATAKTDKTTLLKVPIRKTRKVDDGVFLSRFLAELTKFKILPKAELLACLRLLLVNLKSYKVDMGAVMIESAGIYLYRSTDSHSKMKIILEVLKRKMSIIKDLRHKILLENAYFSVLPPEESQNVAILKDPLKAYISLLVRSISSERRGRDPIKILMGIDWKDDNIVNYLCKQLSDACSLKYDYLPDVADAVRTLSDEYMDLGVYVVDSVLETIRISLETNRISFQQRLFCSINYLNWLYICGVCDFSTIIQVLYQIISLGLNLESLSLDQLIRRTFRIKAACDLVIDVWIYVDPGKPRIQLDHFIHFLLYFHYQTKKLWSDRLDDLGDYPLDVDDKIQRLLKHIIAKSGKRKGNKFAKDYETAKENVKRIDNKYKLEVKKLSQKLKNEAEMIGNINLESIREEEDDEDDYEDEEESEVSDEDEAEDDQDIESEEIEEEKNTRYVDASAPEEIHVHYERKYDENDEIFNREYERMLADSMQIASHQPRQTAIDLSVPPSVRQKFERRVNFAGEQSEDKPSNIQMALMTKAKGKPTLKPVHMQVSQSMKDTWDEQRKTTEQERKQVKQITLQMNERIQQRVDDETLQNPAVVPGKYTIDPAECHIPAGPRARH